MLYPAELSAYEFNSLSETTFCSYSNLISLFSVHISFRSFVSRHICFKRCLAQVISLVAERIDKYGIHSLRIFRSSYRNFAWVGLEPTTTEFCSDSLTFWATSPWVQLALRDYFLQPLQFHLFVQCSCFISVVAFASGHIWFMWSLAQVITLVVEWINAYGIHQWSIFRNSYRNFARVGFKPRTTESLSDALSDWAIRPWVQLVLRDNFVQLLQFHLFVQCSCIISVFAFKSHHIYFKRSLAQIIT